jgi:CheY-like chemotaxis protein
MRRTSVKPQNRIVKVLIVEESGAMCRLLRALVEGLPVAISECHDRSQVLAACAQIQPEWVLMDLDLAGLDAFAAARQITTTHPGTRILLLSEDDNPKLRDIAVKAGVWAIVLKESLIDVRRFLEPAAEEPETQGRKTVLEGEIQ